MTLTQSMIGSAIDEVIVVTPKAHDVHGSCAQNRRIVRNRMKATATRRSIGINFRRTSGDMIRFQIVEHSRYPMDEQKYDLHWIENLWIAA